MAQQRVPQNPRLRGIVNLRPGKWGAMITVNKRRIWLGTYERAVDAAIAYDRVNLKLERYDSLNFPLFTKDYDEMRFQDMYPLESIISMVRIGSYDWTFSNFLSREALLKAIRHFASLRHGHQCAGGRASCSNQEGRKPVVLFGACIN